MIERSDPGADRMPRLAGESAQLKRQPMSLFASLSRVRTFFTSHSPRRVRGRKPRCVSLEGRYLLSVSLAETTPANAYVGSPVVWTATAKGHGRMPVYQFSVGPVGGPLQIVQDFGQSNQLTWNPMQQGTYEVQVIVKAGFGPTRREVADATFTAQSRVVGDQAVVSPMANPLVALFSAPPAPGGSMLVQFAQDEPTLSWQNTSPEPIIPGESTNFIVAGMLPDTTYLMRYVLDNGMASAPLSFTTGSLPSYLNFPAFTVVQPPGPAMDLNQSVIFHSVVSTGTTRNIPDALATDLAGNVTWYFDQVVNNFPGYAQNLEPGGLVTLIGGKAVGVAGGYNMVREVNLAGNTLHQTDVGVVNAQLLARHMLPIEDFDHEAKLLPNGDTVVIGATPKIVDYHGTPTRFVGDTVIVLDPNFRVSWAWNSFRWLNTNRLGTDHPIPSDWLHANAVTWSPEDNNLIVSLRTQDWAVKIDYANGAGNGHIIWKLGAGGNFKPISNDPSPWFTHQHDVRMINNNTLLVFDDGNTRHEFNPNADSRGQEWILNEQNMTATLVVNADMGNYSSFLGSAELLSNGNLAFTSGGLVLGPNQFAGQSIEVLPNGTRIYVLQMNQFEYRSYFESTLYSASLLN